MVLQPPAEPPKAPKAIELPGWLTWALKDGKGLVAFVGVLVYGVARIATEAYYRTFNLSPEDVGVTHAAIIGKAGLYLVLFLAALAAVVALPTAAGLRIREVVWRKEWGGGHGHAHEASEQAAALWGLLAALGFLPVVLAVFSPEFTHFLLGYGVPGRNGPMTLRLALGAWTAGLCIIAYLALQCSCPLWNRVHPKGWWMAISVAVFLPLVLAAVLGTFLPHDSGAGATAARWVRVLAFAWPLLILLAFLAGRGRVKDAGTRLGLSAVWSSLVFYGLTFPLTMTVLSEGHVRAWFPSGQTLDRYMDEPYSSRLDLGYALGARAAGLLLFVGTAALLAWWLSGCHGKGEEEVRPSPRSAAVALVGLVGFAAVAVLLVANARGEALADRARLGDFQRAPLTLLVVSADPVCLSGTNAPAFLGPYMYLGKAKDKHVLFDLGSPNFSRPRRTLLVPADARISYLSEDLFEAGGDQKEEEDARARAAIACAARAGLDAAPPAASPS